MNDLSILTDADILQVFEENAFFLDDSAHEEPDNDLLVTRGEVKEQQTALEAEMRRRGLTPKL